MLTLIELYDNREALNNTLGLYLLRPDETVVFIDRADIACHPENTMEGFLRAARLPGRVTYRACDAADAARVADDIQTLLMERGAENCVVDVLGGAESMLIAVGTCCQIYPELRVLSRRGAKPFWLWGPSRGQLWEGDCRLSVRCALAAAGGEMTGCGHTDWRELDEDTLTLIPRVFGVYMRNRAAWPDFSHFLQKLCSDRYRVKEACYTGPRVFRCRTAGNRTLSPDMRIAAELSEIGVLRELRLTGTGCSAAFRSERIARYLCDTGSWLELYLYSVLCRRALFDDLEINAVISWDNDEDEEDTTNEIDLIASVGLRQVFISCKSGVPDNAALHEIATLRRRFGSRCARAVLATACDLQRDAPAVYRRAADMGVTVIDAPMLDEETVADTFARLCEN